MATRDKVRGEPAGFDRRSGEVHGSGSGAGGGGDPREDYDADPKGGGGADPVTAPPDEQRPVGGRTDRNARR